MLFQYEQLVGDWCEITTLDTVSQHEALRHCHNANRLTAEDGVACLPLEAKVTNTCLPLEAWEGNQHIVTWVTTFAVVLQRVRILGRTFS